MKVRSWTCCIYFATLLLTGMNLLMYNGTNGLWALQLLNFLPRLAQTLPFYLGIPALFGCGEWPVQMVHKNKGTNVLLLIHSGGDSLSSGIRYIVCIQLFTEWPDLGLFRQNLGQDLISVLSLLGPDKLQTFLWARFQFLKLVSPPPFLPLLYFPCFHSFMIFRLVSSLWISSSMF